MRCISAIPPAPIPAPHRGHVAAGAVLGLERPAKAHGDEFGHRIHKGAVAGHLRRIRTWVKQKCRFPSSAWPKMMAS